MNDIILSALLNLFALFGALTHIDKKRAVSIITDYLTKHFGVRNLESYLGLYSDLREFYDEYPDLDKNVIIEGVCSSLQHKIEKEEQTLLLLRFMEFCNISTQAGQEDLFKKVADHFNIPDSLYEDFVSFVSATPSENVQIIQHPGLDGVIKVLNITLFNKLIFTYSGNEEVMLNDVPVLPGLFLVWQQSGVFKSKNSAPLYYSNIISFFKGKSTLSKIELCGNSLEFRFPNSDNGIHNFSFSLHEGELVAIMGGSGVGKSTLLSLLNGSLAPQSGSLKLNGYDISNEMVKGLIGYVPQDDLLIEELTVFENLWFTARLCFDKMDDNSLREKVISVLEDLGLGSSRDLKVGSPINKFISGGQRKRLNIALELIREPSVLFLDEPTSGLSSSDSEKVINLLKEQTYKGKLIVVNIHQPSSDIFKLFDKLWILDKGGYPIYDGNPIEAVTYFKQSAEYADALTSTCPVCGNINPELIFNIIDAKSIDDSGQITEKRKVTPVEWHELYVKSRKEVENPAAFTIPKSLQRKPSALKQLFIFLERNARTKLTNLQYLLITLLEAPALAAIVALLTRFVGEEGYTLMDNKNFVSYLFMAVIVSVFIGMSGSAEEIFRDRALLKREKFLRLSRSSYLWSKILFMAGVSFIQTLLFVVVGNAIIGVHDLFFVWWGVLFLSAFLANLTGLVLSQSLNSIVAIYITIPLLLIPQILLCGMVVRFDDLAPNSKTGNVPIIGDVIPSRWAFEALAVTSYTSNKYEKPLFDNDKEKFSAQYYKSVYLYELETQLEKLEDGGRKVIHQSLPHLERVCKIEPYQNRELEYGALEDHFNKMDSILSRRSNYYRLALDAQINEQIADNGFQALINLKSSHTNNSLETFVINSNSEKTHKVVDGSIVPMAGFVFLDPVSHNGRAPFYSGVKFLGNYSIPTLWFNIVVLLLMCILTSLALFLDFPGRFIRK